MPARNCTTGPKPHPTARLARLRVINLQRHRLTDVELGAEVTTFIGPNGRGKSGLVRALRWVSLNLPQGERLLRRGAAAVRVDLWDELGRRVTRRRGAGVNTYAFDGKLYKAFGATVPDEVAAHLRVGPANFQRQLDPPFWFGQPAAEVSRELNKVVCLTAIDSSLSKAATGLRKARGVREVCEQRMKDCERRLGELDWVDECTAEMTALTERKNSIEAETSSVAALRAVLARVRSAEEVRQNVADATLGATAALQAGERRNKLHESCERLRGVIECVRRAETTLREARRRSRGARERWDAARAGSCPVCGRGKSPS